MDIPLWCYLTALVIGGIACKLWKWDIGMLVAYLFLVLCTAVLLREPFNGIHFQPKILWSWKEWNIQKKQIVANVIMFIPIGLLLGRMIGWQGVFVAAWISVAIELLQLVTGRGLCEIDDVIHNSMGGAIGVAGSVLVRKNIMKSQRTMRKPK